MLMTLGGGTGIPRNSLIFCWDALEDTIKITSLALTTPLTSTVFLEMMLPRYLHEHLQFFNGHLRTFRK